MVTTNGEWVVDLETMSCCHASNKTKVFFEKKGDLLEIRLDNVEMSMSDKSSGEQQAERRKATLKNAAAAFTKVYYDKVLEASNKRILLG